MVNLRTVLVSIFAIAAVGASAQSFTPEITRQMGIDQKLGDSVPKDMPMTDETGKQIKLGDLLGKRPVFIMPVFYSCQGICGVEEEEIVATAAKMRLTYPVGSKFDVVMVSIHPKETYELARGRKNELMNELAGTTREPSLAKGDGWHLLTTTPNNIKKLTDALGFRYVYDDKTNRIYHPAGAMMLTPDGRISQYFYGAQYPTKLLEASIDSAVENKIGRPAQVILLGCIQVDPATGKRTLMIERVVNAACVVTVLALAFWITSMLVQSKKAAAESEKDMHKDLQ